MQFCLYKDRFVEFNLDFTQAAGASYDACTASGDVMVLGCNVYVEIPGGGDLTSISVQSTATTPMVLLTAGEGITANLLAQSHPAAACQAWIAPWTLRSGHKIQYTITAAGAAHTGSGKLIVHWAPISAGAVLT
jgi:hypothetical protein